MSRRYATPFAIAVTLAAGSALLIAAQPTERRQVQPSGAKPAAAEPPMMSPEEMKSAWKEANRTNPNHERLKMIEGTWSAVVKHWMPGSDKAEESTGTMVNTLIHDGRFIHHDFKGTFDGEKFVGSGHFGFDNGSGKFQSTWIDSMSTGIMFSTGTYNESAREWTMTSEMYCPMMKCAVKHREVVKVLSRDKHVMTMYMTMPDQPEFKGMEITYTRK
ncbi:MAG: DUF1579 domain-containing protein [Phycisphaeraceae bacterium]|nr:DUF1579 domain-containing protein [Phycisphaeraceae bacterium]